MNIKTFSILIITFSFFLTSCSSTYMKKVESAHRYYFKGQYEDAIKVMDEITPPSRDRLVYLMDKGMILHAAGRYEDSNKVLSEAEDLADALSAKSISREVAATLGSEEATEFAGDPHERMVIPVVRMLNYVMLDDWDGALVEVRRVQTVAEREFGNFDSFDNAFAIYLSALIWESLGHLNDAFIDYKKLAKFEKDVPYYAIDTAETGKRLGIQAKLPSKESIAWEKSENYREKNMGQLIVIAEAGRSPQYVSDSVSNIYFTIAMPFVVSWPGAPTSSQVFVDGRSIGNTYPFYNIADDIMEALKARQKRSLVRKIIKTSVQAGLYAASGELIKSDDKKEQGIGIALGLLSLFMSAAEKADERSWRTLPANFQIGRFYLPPGTHEIEIKPEHSSESISNTVEIKKERPKVLVVHVPPAYGSSIRLATSTPKIESAMASEKRITAKLADAPKDGELKVDLAFARIARGDYNVEVLLNEAIKQGGNKQRALQGLVIAHTVKGNFDSAASYANEGGYSNYESAILFHAGKNDNAPSIDTPDKAVDDIKIAFDFYCAGLVAEKSKDFKQAARMFSESIESGLIGHQVANKALYNFKLTDDDFKKSEEGIDIASNLADAFIVQNVGK